MNERKIFETRVEAFWAMYHDIFGDGPSNEGLRLTLWDNAVNGQYKHFPFTDSYIPEGYKHVYYDAKYQGSVSSGFFKTTDNDGNVIYYVFGDHIPFFKDYDSKEYNSIVAAENNAKE